jgi:isoleucyl-tRNA synthetase
MRLRDDALAQLDKLTRQIGKYKALDAEIVYEISDADLRRRLEAHGPDLEDMAGAGSYSFAPAADGKAGVTVKLLDRREAYASCARCWKRRPDVGRDAQFADLCQRCVAAVRATGMTSS